MFTRFLANKDSPRQEPLEQRILGVHVCNIQPSLPFVFSEVWPAVATVNSCRPFPRCMDRQVNPQGLHAISPFFFFFFHAPPFPSLHPQTSKFHQYSSLQQIIPRPNPCSCHEPWLRDLAFINSLRILSSKSSITSPAIRRTATV